MAGKIIIMPDSFKGSMTAKEVADILCEQAEKYTDKDVKAFPIADGGEGSIDCILSFTGGERIEVQVHSPEWKMIPAYYGVTEDNRGIIEFAQSSGLTKQTSFAATKATSYGFGELIKDALERGIREFILCLGGSATTDGACGMAAALGVKFLDCNGNEFVPVGESLADIACIDDSGIDERLKDCHFEVMCDVENPLYGPLGAAFVYAGQKGASKEEQVLLDQGLQHLCQIVLEKTGIDYSEKKGGGAAGGAGCGCEVFLDAKLKSGIDVILDLCHFEQELEDCEYIITGEGKLDPQSMMGKVLSGIRKRSGEIPMISFCGVCELDEGDLEKIHVQAIEIGKGLAVEEAMLEGKRLLIQESSRFFTR